MYYSTYPGIYQNKCSFKGGAFRSFIMDGYKSASYFCATTGSVSMETVKKYIEEQRTEEHKRKYMKSGKYKKQKS